MKKFDTSKYSSLSNLIDEYPDTTRSMLKLTSQIVRYAISQGFKPDRIQVDDDDLIWINIHFKNTKWFETFVFKDIKSFANKENVITESFYLTFKLEDSYYLCVYITIGQNSFLCYYNDFKEPLSFDSIFNETICYIEDLSNLKWVLEKADSISDCIRYTPDMHEVLTNHIVIER